MSTLNLPPYNSIDFAIGNTDFQILFTPTLQHKTKEWKSPLHFHLFAECHFLMKGKVSLTTESQNIILEKSMFCFIPNGLQHEIEALESNTEEISFYIVFSKNKTEQNNTFDRYKQLFSSEAIFMTYTLSDTFEKIVKLVGQSNIYNFLSETKLKLLLSLALLELLEQLNEKYISEYSSKSMNYSDGLTLQIQSFMIENFSFDSKLEDLSDYLCLSPRQTERLLKKVFNCSFSEFKNKKRIERAQQMLTASSDSFKEVAEKLGYQNYSGFYKMFYAQIGMSPEEYVKKART